MKKKMIYFLITLFFLAAIGVVHARYEPEPVFYSWDSNYSEIGYIPAATISVGRTASPGTSGLTVTSVLNNSVAQKILNYGSSAASTWINRISNKSYSDAGLYQMGTITIVAADKTAMPGAPDTVIGLTQLNKTFEKVAYNSALNPCYSVSKITSAMIYVIYNHPSFVYTDSKINAIMTHEIGHALGYIGHSNSSNNCMQSGSTSTSISNSVINHMKNVYNIN